MCAKVWDLSNPKRESNFTFEMCLIAIHLLMTSKKDTTLQLPDKLPIELKVSASEQDSTAEISGNDIGLVRESGLLFPL